MRLILHVFFGSSGANFATGVHIVCPRGDFVVRAEFGGFLADLLGHKEITDWKGTGALVVCMECDNIVNHNHRQARRGLRAKNHCRPPCCVLNRRQCS